VETIGSKRSYALIWCMPNNDDDDEVIQTGLDCAACYKLMYGVYICMYVQKNNFKCPKVTTVTTHALQKYQIYE